jgi:hypothetical protein
VRNLFTGNMQDQSAAAAHALRLTKGVQTKFRIALAGVSLPTIATGPAYVIAGDLIKMESAADGTPLSTGASTAVSASTGVVAAGPALGVGVLLGPAYRNHEKKFDVVESATDAAAIPIRDPEQPVAAAQLPLDAVDGILRSGRVPAAIEFECADSEKLSGDMTETEPYYFEERRHRNFAQRSHAVWKKITAGAATTGESMSEPFLRQAVKYRAWRTRKDRHELRKLADQGRQKSGGPDKQGETALGDEKKMQ